MDATAVPTRSNDLVLVEEDRYLDQDFEECEEILNSLFEDMSSAETRIVKIKEMALLWVYTVEWLVVMATFMLSSFVLWTLMMRRKLYRPVGTTQLGDFSFR